MNKSVYKSYGFWVSISAAVLLIVQSILSGVGIELQEPYATEVIRGILAILVITGVISRPKSDEEVIEDNYADIIKDNKDIDQKKLNFDTEQEDFK